MCDSCNCCDDDSDYSTTEDLYSLSIDQYGVVYRLNKETGDTYIKTNETLKKPDGSVEHAYYWKRVLDEHEFTRYKAERERVLTFYEERHKAEAEREKTAKMAAEAAKAKAEEEAKKAAQVQKDFIDRYVKTWPTWIDVDFLYTISTK